MLAETFAALYAFADVVTFLVLSAAGLAIIFGMMGIINMAHGEFIMCGAYVTATMVHAGMPLPLAQLSGAVTAGLVGVVLELTVVRHLYKRPLDSILATWGVSLIVTQGVLITLGSTYQGIGTPEGSFAIGDYSYSIYRFVLFGSAALMLAGVYLLFNRTRFGVHARATIQDPAMARALGVRTNGIYAASFGIGAGLAGLTGALYAPTLQIVPTMGVSFLVEAFVTVVVGGADIVFGTAAAAIALGLVRTVLNGLYGQVIGQIGLLIAVIVIIRLLPQGISGWIRQRRS